MGLATTTPSTPIWAWFAVGALLGALIAVDVLANRGGRRPTFRRALVASAGWITVSIVFGIVLGLVQGWDISQQYFAGYMLEKALSIDNVFVFAVLFAALAVPPDYQHRILYFGVVGALLLRGAFIAGGAALLERFSWVLYVFGAVLIAAGLRMAKGEPEVDPSRNLAVRAVRHVVPVTPDYRGERFVVKEGARRSATPLLVALVAVEATDLVFATDSIPAVFGVTRNVFVVFTSNAFAVLGLRALYFVFAGAMDRFRYLRHGLAVVLTFIGVKVLVEPVVHVPVMVSLAVIVLVVGVAVLASTLRRPAARTGAGSED